MVTYCPAFHVVCVPVYIHVSLLIFCINAFTNKCPDLDSNTEEDQVELRWCRKVFF